MQKFHWTTLAVADNVCRRNWSDSVGVSKWQASPSFMPEHYLEERLQFRLPSTRTRMYNVSGDRELINGEGDSNLKLRQYPVIDLYSIPVRHSNRVLP